MIPLWHVVMVAGGQYDTPDQAVVAAFTLAQAIDFVWSGYEKSIPGAQFDGAVIGFAHVGIAAGWKVVDTPEG